MMTTSSFVEPPFRNLTTVSAKRKARRFAMQGLYEWQMNKNPIVDIEAHTRAINAMHKVDVRYYHELLQGVAAQVGIIDQLFVPILDRDKTAMTGVELAILRVATFELKERLEVPYKVVIDQAIELAKEFGAADSHKYINGVLDKLAHQLRAVEIQHAK